MRIPLLAETGVRARADLAYATELVVAEGAAVFLTVEPRHCVLLED
jgi:hypothetical protein